MNWCAFGQTVAILGVAGLFVLAFVWGCRVVDATLWVRKAFKGELAWRHRYAGDTINRLEYQVTDLLAREKLIRDELSKLRPKKAK